MLQAPEQQPAKLSRELAMLQLFYGDKCAPADVQ